MENLDSKVLKRIRNFCSFSFINKNYQRFIQLDILYSEKEQEILDFLDNEARIFNLQEGNIETIEDLQFSTLDGFVFNLFEPPSYDSDFDTSNPTLLIGVEGPSAEKRHKGFRKRRFYLPRELKKFNRKNLEFWDSSRKTLSDLQSSYPHLEMSLITGKFSSREALGLILYITIEREELMTDTIPGGEFFRKIKEKALGHNFEGKWHLIGHLLQLSANRVALTFKILDNFPSNRSRQSLISLGRNLWNRSYISLGEKPVKETNRKRGYKDKGSRKLPHENHGEREFLPIEVYEANDGKLEVSYSEATKMYVLGGLNPKRTYIYKEGFEYLKEIKKENEKRIKESKKRQRDYEKSQNGPVISYFLEEDKN